MKMTYKKTKDCKVFMAFYGHIGFAVVVNQPGSRNMTLGIVKDAKAVNLEMDTCNRADFETSIEGINDPTGIAGMYKELVKLLVKEAMAKTVKLEG